MFYFVLTYFIYLPNSCLKHFFKINFNFKYLIYNLFFKKVNLLFYIIHLVFICIIRT